MVLYVGEAIREFTKNWKYAATATGIIALYIGLMTVVFTITLKSGASFWHALAITMPLTSLTGFLYYLAQIYIYKQVMELKDSITKTLMDAVRGLLAIFTVSIGASIIAMLLFYPLMLLLATIGAKTLADPTTGILAVVASIIAIVLIGIIVYIATKIMYVPVLAAKGYTTSEILAKIRRINLKPALSAFAGMAATYVAISIIVSIIIQLTLVKFLKSFVNTLVIDATFHTIVNEIGPIQIAELVITSWFTLLLGTILWFFPYVSAKDAIPEEEGMSSKDL